MKGYLHGRRTISGVNSLIKLNLPIDEQGKACSFEVWNDFVTRLTLREISRNKLEILQLPFV